MSAVLESIFRALCWELVAVAFSLSLWPVVAKWIPRPFAWPVVRLAAPWVVAYVALIPALVLDRTPFGVWTVITVAIVAAAAGWASDRSSGGNAWKELRRADWKPFECTRLLFLVLAASFVAFIPSVNDMGERMRDTAIWTALLRDKSFPFDEPWLAGTPIRYYVFGYYGPALLALCSGTPALVAYNLALVWVVVQYGSALFVLVRALGMRPTQAALGAGMVFLASNGRSVEQAWGALFAGRSYDWWKPSRVIDNTINEFPLWTATLGDLHPHYLALPLFAGIAALAIYQARQGAGPTSPEGRRLDWAKSLAGGVLVGWMWGTNTWEVPVATALLGAALLPGLPARGLKATFQQAAAIPVVALLVAMPFIRHAAKAERAFGIVEARSGATEIALVFGLFLLPIILLPLVTWWRSERRDWLVGIAMLSGLSFAIDSGLLLAASVAILLALALVWEKDADGRIPTALALFATGVVVFCELFHLRDVYGQDLERLNTVFKFYMPTWTLMGAAAFLAAVRLGDKLEPRVRWSVGGIWGLALGSHLLVGIPARTGHTRGPSSLEGLDYLGERLNDDAALIRWMAQEVREGRLSGTLLEAVGGAYSLHNRFASAAGLPGFIGWQGYGYWSIQGISAESDRRRAIAQEIWDGRRWKSRGGSCSAVAEALREAGIRYVAIGTLERKAYAAADLTVLENCLRTLRREQASVLLAVE